jgi:hypothetical protein
MRIISRVNLAALLLLGATAAALADGVGPFTSGVPSADPAVGSPANVVSSDFTAHVVATGTDPIENPSGPITTFGKLSDGTQTEPDQNTFFHDDGVVRGPVKNYNYGHNFLIQGHEDSGNLAYVTRINLDVTDPAHRITLLTPVGGDSLTHFNRVDGSVFNPFTKSFLFTQEGGGTDGGVIEISNKFPAKVTTRYGVFGRCGLEGIHTDNRGNFYLVEDIGGTSASVDQNDINGTKAARQPNSYVFRLVPYDKNDLNAGGQLQALQVSVDGSPLAFGGTSAAQVFADVWSTKQVELHSGASFPTKWITIHDTATGTADFDCNATARAAGATPFKRPENGHFKPDGTFRTFYFATTGDTSNTSGSVAGLAQRGAWGGVFQLDLNKDGSGKIKLIVLGDPVHNSFDNVTFGDSNTLLVAEDRGDTLHDQLNTLDSIWAYPLTDLAHPLRLLAQGRDVSASGVGVEDNEPTGIHVLAGVKDKSGQSGTPPSLFQARAFFTQQHGDNTIYELIHN